MSVHYRNWILRYKQIAHRWARHIKSSKHVFNSGSTIDSPNMLPTMIHYRLSKHVTHHDPLSTLQTCYPPWSLSTLQTCYPSWSTIDSPNMLPTMIHGQAFWRLTWKPPSKGNPYPLVVMCWTKDEQCLRKTQIMHLSNSRAPLSTLTDVRRTWSTCCVYLLNHMLFFSFYLL